MDTKHPINASFATNQCCTSKLSIGDGSLREVIHIADRTLENVADVASCYSRRVIGGAHAPLVGLTDKPMQLGRVWKVVRNQSGLGQQVWSKLGESLKYQVEVGVWRALQKVTPAQKLLSELASPNIRLAVKDGLAGNHVAVLGEIVRDVRDDSGTNNGRSDALKNYIRFTHWEFLWMNAIGCVIGIGLFMLWLRFFGTGAQSPNDPKLSDCAVAAKVERRRRQRT